MQGIGYSLVYEFLLSILLMRITHMRAHKGSLFFLTATYFFIVWACHNSFLSSKMNRNLDCFQLEATVTNDNIPIHLHIFFWICVRVPVAICLGAGWLEPRECIYSTFVENSKKFYQFTLQLIAMYALPSIQQFHSCIIINISCCWSFYL